MEFSLNPDQTALLDAVEKIAAPLNVTPVDFDGFYFPGDELDAALTEGQFFDIADIPELGLVAAVAVIERLAQLPCAAEVALSMLVKPLLAEDLPRPVAIIEHGRPGRFVADARSVLVIDKEGIGLAHPEKGDAESLESLYAYPMGQLQNAQANSQRLTAQQASAVESRLRLACAAELLGLMQAALDATVEHVSIRKQFGRPLGTFQALRHRLAECAVLVGGVRHLVFKAAASDEAGDAALALLHAQDSATRLTYDVHQMLGAMGMTLEMTLHLYTYRIKALLSEQGGRSQQAAAVAEHCF